VWELDICAHHSSTINRSPSLWETSGQIFKFFFVEDRLLRIKDMPSKSQRMKRSHSGRQGKQDQHEAEETGGTK